MLSGFPRQTICQDIRDMTFTLTVYLFSAPKSQDASKKNSSINNLFILYKSACTIMMPCMILHNIATVRGGYCPAHPVKNPKNPANT